MTEETLINVPPLFEMSPADVHQKLLAMECDGTLATFFLAHYPMFVMPGLSSEEPGLSSEEYAVMTFTLDEAIRGILPINFPRHLRAWEREEITMRRMEWLQQNR